MGHLEDGVAVAEGVEGGQELRQLNLEALALMLRGWRGVTSKDPLISSGWNADRAVNPIMERGGGRRNLRMRLRRTLTRMKTMMSSLRHLVSRT